MLRSEGKGTVRSTPGKACRGKVKRGPGWGSRAITKASRGGAPGKVPTQVVQVAQVAQRICSVPALIPTRGTMVLSIGSVAGQGATIVKR